MNGRFLTMMFFGDGQFPKCGGYMRSKIVGLSKSSKVYSALVECIGSKKFADLAITAGTYPRLIVEDLVKGYITLPAYFERVVLHETVHWGRHMAGLPSEIDGKEAGSWFEHLAYNIPYKWHGDVKCS
jgi:hypothetical protein